MAENSKIEWTDHSVNLWVGCQAVSMGCANCYAKAQVERYGGDFSTRRRTALENWKKPYRWNRYAEANGIRFKVFANSLSDFFDKKVPSSWRDDAWDLIAKTPHLDWILVTKRPQNILKMKMLPPGWGKGWPNVWILVTAENQEEADRRIPLLLEITAAIHGVSIEPMLGPVDLRPFPGLNWAIAGGESGRGRRPINLDWMRDVRDQCAEMGIAFFGKQKDKVTDLPPDLLVREFPKVRELEHA